MIGVPMANPRGTVIADLHCQMDAFFGAGKKAEQIAAGVSGEVGGPIKCARTNKLRTERDKLAPTLKQLAESGTSINKAAAALGIDHKRARLIARENGFKFTDSP